MTHNVSFIIKYGTFDAVVAVAGQVSKRSSKILIKQEYCNFHMLLSRASNLTRNMAVQRLHVHLLRKLIKAVLTQHELKVLLIFIDLFNVYTLTSSLVVQLKINRKRYR